MKHRERRGVITLGCMTASYIAALLSKEISLILPLLILLCHYTFKKSVDKKAFAVLAATIAGYILWRLFVVGTGSMAEGAVPTLLERLPGVFVALTNYFRLLLFPFDLHMEYGGILFPFTEPKAVIGVILFGILLVYVFRKREQDRFLLFAAGWFFIALLPSSNLFFPINAYMAEHWIFSYPRAVFGFPVGK
jgi:hypothetical protein